MVWPAIAAAALAAGASLGGNYMTARMNRNTQRRQHKAAKNLYKKRYQYTMRDMKKAGLNPILAYQTGVGSTPSMSGGFAAPDFSQGVSSAVSAARAVQDYKLQEQQGKLLKEQTYNTQIDSHLKSAQQDKALSESGLAQEQMKMKALEVDRMSKYGSGFGANTGYSIERILKRIEQNKGARKEVIDDWNKRYGPWVRKGKQ